MEEESGLLPVPILSNSAILWSAVLFLGLLISAISLEMFRQSVAQRRRIRGYWRSAEDIVRNKELSDREWRELRALIQHWSPKDPLRIISERYPFDSAVGKEMAELLRQGKQDQYHELGVILRDVRTRLSHDYVPLGQRIHSTREIFNNQRIWIAEAGTKSPNWVEVKTIGVNEGFLMLGPTAAGKEVPSFKPGTKVHCRMWRDDDARYLFELEYSGRNSELQGLNFYHSSNMERVQARQYYRVPHNQTADLEVISNPVDDAEGRVDFGAQRSVTTLRGRITNVSAGGFAAVVHQPIAKQVFLRVTLDLEESESLTVVSKIVSSVEMAGGRYLLRTQYEGLAPDDREKVVKHVTIKQQHFEESRAR